MVKHLKEKLEIVAEILDYFDKCKEKELQYNFPKLCPKCKFYIDLHCPIRGDCYMDDCKFICKYCGQCRCDCEIKELKERLFRE